MTNIQRDVAFACLDYLADVLHRIQYQCRAMATDDWQTMPHTSGQLVALFDCADYLTRELLSKHQDVLGRSGVNAVTDFKMTMLTMDTMITSNHTTPDALLDRLRSIHALIDSWLDALTDIKTGATDTNAPAPTPQPASSPTNDTGFGLPCHIAATLNDGKHACIYVHQASRFESMLSLLQRNYTDQAKVDRLIGLGDCETIAADINACKPYANFGGLWAAVEPVYGDSPYDASHKLMKLMGDSSMHRYLWDGTEWTLAPSDSP